MPFSIFRSGSPTQRRRVAPYLLSLSGAAALVAAGGLWAAIALMVVPTDFADTPGDSPTSIPFGDDVHCNNGIRFQQVIDGQPIGIGNIDSLAFRLAEGENAVGPLTYSGVKVRLASTSAAPSSMSQTFEDNWGADTTLVFSGDLDVELGTNPSAPHPFDLEIPVEAPFQFNGNNSNLLIDIEIDDCPSSAYFLDATDDDTHVSAIYDGDIDSPVGMPVSSALITQVLISSPPPMPPAYNCPAIGGGDNLGRGFHLEDFPGHRLDEVTLTYRPTQPGTYRVRLNAYENSYDGRQVGRPKTVSFTVSDTDPVEQTFDFQGAPVAEGSTIAFSQELISSPSGGSLSYDRGPCSLGDSACNECPGVVQTHGTSPDLDSFRRSSVAVEVMPSMTMRGISGNWAVDGHDGEGFMIDRAENGSLVAIWFTYDHNGEQMWLIGVDSGFEGNRAAMPLFRITGPVFGPDFDPADRDDQHWGTLTITFDDCSSGRVSYNSLTGFGAEVYEISRAYAVEHSVCP